MKRKIGCKEKYDDDSTLADPQLLFHSIPFNADDLLRANHLIMSGSNECKWSQTTRIQIVTITQEDV